MTDSKLATFTDINWTNLRANALKNKGWRNKSPQDWDAKAASFAARNKSAAYVELFLALLPLEPNLSVLDVGSGPGTLSIPIAKKVRSVTAIDYSTGMLAAMKSIAEKENITNLTAIHCAWEDDWHAKGIDLHDIAIASRAMGVEDLEAAIKKIDSYATKYVFLSDRIGATPFDEAAFNAIGRPFLAGPDYIYTINILYTLGIHPNMTVLTLDQEICFSSIDEAMNSYLWMFTDITSDETLALERYLRDKIVTGNNGQLILHREAPPRWAVIWWEK